MRASSYFCSSISILTLFFRFYARLLKNFARIFVTFVNWTDFCLFRTANATVFLSDPGDGSGCAIDSDNISCMQYRSSISAAHNGRNTELSGHDGRVGKRRADVCDHGGNFREYQGPTDIRGDGDQDLAFVYFLDMIQIGNDTYGAGDFSGGAGEAFDVGIRRKILRRFFREEIVSSTVG